MSNSKRKFRNIKRRQRKQLAIITVIIMIAAIAAIMLLTPGFDIKHINVYGNTVIKAEDIVFQSGITEGVNIFDVSIKNAKKNILSIGYVESVKIKRRLPSTIDITVVEEVGVAYLKADKGYVIITADGRCIDVTDGIAKNDKGDHTMELPKLPVITGLGKVKYKVGDVITSEDDPRKLEVLFECLYEFSKDNHIFNMIEIDLSRLDEIKFYYLNRNLCVIVGNDQKLSYKMDSFGTTLKKIMEKDNPAPKGTLDLSRVDTLGQVIYREPEADTVKKEE